MPPCPPGVTGFNASSAHLVSSQGPLWNAFTISALHLFPSFPLCDLPSGNPLYGISNSPIDSASCVHLFGYVKRGFSLRLLCVPQGYAGKNNGFFFSPSLIPGIIHYLLCGNLSPLAMLPCLLPCCCHVLLLFFKISLFSPSPFSLCQVTH